MRSKGNNTFQTVKTEGPSHLNHANRLERIENVDDLCEENDRRFWPRKA